MARAFSGALSLLLVILVLRLALPEVADLVVVIIVKILTIFSPITIVMFISISLILSRLLNNVIGVSIALSCISLVMLIVLPLWLKKHLYY